MQYLRRLVWFFAKKLLVWFVLLGMLACGFFMALNLANVYVILDEGLEARVRVLLTQEDAQELSKYFTGEFLTADPALQHTFDGSSIYNYYSITDFSYKLKIEKMWSWPWDDYATATVVERVPVIAGKVLAGHADDVPAGKPTYAGGRYKITLLKGEDALWRIAGMQQTAEILEAAPTEVEN